MLYHHSVLPVKKEPEEPVKEEASVPAEQEEPEEIDTWRSVDDVFQPDGPFFTYDGHTYCFYDVYTINENEYGNVTDADAGAYKNIQKFCRDQDGHLAVIDSIEENEELFYETQERYDHTVFFGLSDENREGRWIWVDGSEDTLSLWSVKYGVQQPDNGNGYVVEHYAEFDYDRFNPEGSDNTGNWNDAAGEITYVEKELCGCKFSCPEKWILFSKDDTSEQYVFDVKKDESGVSVSFTQADIAGLEKGIETMAEEWAQTGEANGFVLEEISRVEGMPNETYVATGTRSVEGFPSKYRAFAVNTDDVGVLYFIEYMLADAITGINKFDLILFLEPTVEFVQDGTRNEKIRENREMYSRQIKDLFDKAGMQYHCIDGDYQKRFVKARELVDSLICRQ